MIIAHTHADDEGVDADFEPEIDLAPELPPLPAEPVNIGAERARRALGIPETTIGTHTLATLPLRDGAAQLVHPFLTPHGTTVFYGPGGVGKGMLCTYLAHRLVQQGHVVMIVDYELNETEWGTRARNMGFTDNELTSVHYRAPFGDEWTAPKGTLEQVAHLIREDCDRLDVTYIIVDSYIAATSTGDGMGGQAAAAEFYAGIKMIGRPAAVIAHVAGGGQRFPDKPFGSVYVHNFARETWSVESVDAPEEIAFDRETNDLQPALLSLELRNKKTNVGATPRPQFITFSFFHDDHIEIDPHAKSAKPKLRDRALDLLQRAAKPMTCAAIVTALNAESDDKVKADSVRQALRRTGNAERFGRLEALPTVPQTWALKA